MLLFEFVKKPKNNDIYLLYLAPNRAKIFGMETSRAELEGLLNKCREHRQNVQQLLVKQEYQRSQAAMRRKMLENLDDSMKSQKPKVCCTVIYILLVK
jgi:hypothetical protein